MKPQRGITRAALLLCVAFLELYAQGQSDGCPAPPANENRPWLNPRYSAQCRARFALGQLKTVDQKFQFLSWGGRGAGRAGQQNLMTEMGLVRGRGGDGPAGVAREIPGVTALPTPLLVAAAFDRGWLRDTAKSSDRSSSTRDRVA